MIGRRDAFHRGERVVEAACLEVEMHELGINVGTAGFFQDLDGRGDALLGLDDAGEDEAHRGVGGLNLEQPPGGGFGVAEASGAFVQLRETLEQAGVGGRVVDGLADDDARLRIRTPAFQQIRELHGKLPVDGVGHAEESLMNAAPEDFFERGVVVRGAAGGGEVSQRVLIRGLALPDVAMHHDGLRKRAGGFERVGDHAEAFIARATLMFLDNVGGIERARADQLQRCKPRADVVRAREHLVGLAAHLHDSLQVSGQRVALGHRLARDLESDERVVRQSGLPEKCGERVQLPRLKLHAGHQHGIPKTGRRAAFVAVVELGHHPDVEQVPELPARFVFAPGETGKQRAAKRGVERLFFRVDFLDECLREHRALGLREQEVVFTQHRIDGRVEGFAGRAEGVAQIFPRSVDFAEIQMPVREFETVARALRGEAVEDALAELRRFAETPAVPEQARRLPRAEDVARWKKFLDQAGLDFSRSRLQMLAERDEQIVALDRSPAFVLMPCREAVEFAGLQPEPEEALLELRIVRRGGHQFLDVIEQRSARAREIQRP